MSVSSCSAVAVHVPLISILRCPRPRTPAPHEVRQLGRFYHRHCGHTNKATRQSASAHTIIIISHTEQLSRIHAETSRACQITRVHAFPSHAPVLCWWQCRRGAQEMPTRHLERSTAGATAQHRNSAKVQTVRERSNSWSYAAASLAFRLITDKAPVDGYGQRHGTDEGVGKCTRQWEQKETAKEMKRPGESARV